MLKGMIRDRSHALGDTDVLDLKTLDSREFRNRRFERCIEPGRQPILISGQNLPLLSCRGAVASGKRG
jgi:hypothetical protein